ncbi:amino acid ABC transporter permease [Paracoccus sediminis]|uniref:Amino acid ABC transporter membrane protein 1, PAAT family n=1 Tax=Paracoccus sediminis TaxID=1214787 RepID=A0A238WD67_9RHOB|nr:amino acid ABC transporter permease [Paracoccus sediminis]TBN50916.1 amino acid ABC transporter permease [Paracoccus sediminis]SNR44500.1 amino acid ABC transporter membrane protein 1, PAAT family [Paracoccus sediminis]
MNLDFGVVWARWPELLMGLGGTLFLALSGMVLALMIGVLGVAVRRSGNRIGSALVIAFVELIRNTPFLVQIFFIFFALPLAGVRLNPTVTAIIALGVNGGAYAIEIIRGGVESIPKGQTEAGLALGLRPGEIFRRIILKPALRAVFPSLSSQFILLTLTTSIATSISAYELTSVAQRIDGDTFRSFEVYFTITAMYLALSWFIMSLFAVITRTVFTYPTR